MVGEMGSQKIMFRIIDTRILELTVTVPSAEMGLVQVGQSSPFQPMPSLEGPSPKGDVYQSSRQ